MKKILTILLSIMIGGSLFIGCGSNKDSSKEQNKQNVNSLEKVKEARKIKIGLDDSYPPMEFRDKSNNLVGFDIDFGNEIGKKLGVEVEFVPTEWKGILLAVQSGKFDAIISGLSITEERKKTILFSEPYVMGGQVIAVKKGNDSINKLDDLKGKILACQMGSTGHEAAKKMEGLKEVKPYDKITEAFTELSIGRIDGVIMDAQVGGYYLAKNPGKFEVLEEKVSEEPMGVGFKKEDTELKEAIQKAIDELKKDGTLSKLSVKWFGFDAYDK
ncbi:ABC transporter substrate-binding protein [Clostridium aestuarii]|uniref:ABC transporter substrate-binding protein n=1 Tax=Clostridium aestuarii TaxID=338193 RepID=A0ABT4D2S4_9CLOT|nr:ABC transporter substrate-binding protein [Clostridium aestuarii]MCY6484343.1 ABC transporter substrate-binding protein [Clostridium aestuarii]